MSTCQKRRQGDQYRCAPCSLLWDINDPSPPECPALRDSETPPPANRATVARLAFMASEAETAGKDLHNPVMLLARVQGVMLARKRQLDLVQTIMHLPAVTPERAAAALLFYAAETVRLALAELTNAEGTTEQQKADTRLTTLRTIALVTDPDFNPEKDYET